jgi:transcriptional regulator with XRE-family HTH domain
MGIGDTVRQHRVARKLTQRALAKLAEVSPAAIHRIEMGEFAPSPKLLVKLGEILGFDTPETIEAPDEVKLIRVWRRVRPEDRELLLRMLEATVHA